MMVPLFFCAIFWSLGYWVGFYLGKRLAKKQLAEAAMRERFLHIVARGLAGRLAAQDQQGEDWKNA
jgi:hypothetical protein